MCHIRMDRVSCVNRIQSEAFISTVALFILSAASPKDDKVHLRLPSVWRDQWHELLCLQKVQDDMMDRGILKSLRDMIDSTESSRNDQRNIPNNGNGQDVHRVMRNPAAVKVNQSPINLEDESSLRAFWKSRVSSTAYTSMHRSRKALPIYAFRDELLQSFERNQVVIICGETGCGKSTQVPAFILEAQLSRGRHCKVMCAEPRRISAISLAHRVSQELGEKKGQLGGAASLVGYAIRFEIRTHARTRLIYATTGIVLRMLESSGGLDDVTHLVLDEVHERK